MMATLLGTIVVLPSYLQHVLQLTPLATGLLLLPGGLLTGRLGPVVGRRYDRVGARARAIFGTTQQLAGAAGVALLVSVFTARSADLAAGGASAAEQTAGGMPAAFLVAACVSLIAIAGALFIRTPAQEVAAAPP
jgi:DHA2 family lincomycin resistance protein-like MFS transporter